MRKSMRFLVLAWAILPVCSAADEEVDHAMVDQGIPYRCVQGCGDGQSAGYSTGHQLGRCGVSGIKADGSGPVIGVDHRRQDHSTLHFGQSCMDTAIKIGQKQFEHGLGTPANSELAVDVPAGEKEVVTICRNGRAVRFGKSTGR